ncbi:MAG: aspartate aminotransferase family protein [Bacteriovoracaceae bacterium]
MSHVYPNYRPFPVDFVRGKGEFLYDVEDKEYIDLLGGIAVLSLGHCHPEVSKTIEEQSKTLMHISNIFKSPWQEKFAKNLIDYSREDGDEKLNRVFFCNSGTEANEAALKLCKFWSHKRQNGKSKVLALRQSFHGRSIGSLCLTGQNKGKDQLGDLLSWVDHVHPNDIEDLDKKFGKDVAGIFIEVVQGEGGLVPLEESFLEAIQKKCDEHGALLVCDEIQGGAFRTGKFWSYQNFNLKPDVVTTAKSVGNGFPVGAMLCSEELSDVIEPGMHGTTFGGNALACEVGNTVITTLKKSNASQNVKDREKFLISKLQGLKEKFPKVVKDFRGLGLWYGIELHGPYVPRECAIKMLDYGLVWGTAGARALRLAPSLLISDESLEKAIDQTEKFFTSL